MSGVAARCARIEFTEAMKNAPESIGSGGGRFRGGPNPQALSACMGKAVGDAVQLDTPAGAVPATCTLIARPNGPAPVPPLWDN